MIYSVHRTINKYTGKPDKTTVLYPKPLLTSGNNYSLGNNFIDTDKNLFLISKYNGIKFFLDFKLQQDPDTMKYLIEPLEEYINGKFDV